MLVTARIRGGAGGLLPANDVLELAGFVDRNVIDLDDVNLNVAQIPAYFCYQPVSIGVTQRVRRQLPHKPAGVLLNYLITTKSGPIRNASLVDQVRKELRMQSAAVWAADRVSGPTQNSLQEHGLSTAGALVVRG